MIWKDGIETHGDRSTAQKKLRDAEKIQLLVVNLIIETENWMGLLSGDIVQC